MEEGRARERGRLFDQYAARGGRGSQSIAWIESINQPLVVILEGFPLWNISEEGEGEGRVIPHKNKEGQLD